MEDLLRCHYLISASLVDSQVQVKTTLNYLVKNLLATGEQMNWYSHLCHHISELPEIIEWKEMHFKLLQEPAQKYLDVPSGTASDQGMASCGDDLHWEHTSHCCRAGLFLWCFQEHLHHPIQVPLTSFTVISAVPFF